MPGIHTNDALLTASSFWHGEWLVDYFLVENKMQSNNSNLSENSIITLLLRVFWPVESKSGIHFRQPAPETDIGFELYRSK